MAPNHIRDVSPFLQRIRTMLMGREHLGHMRFAGKISPRTQPDPAIPPGVHHKLANNHYCTRDARRSVQPTELIFESTGSDMPRLAEKSSSKSETAVAPASPQQKTPGTPYLPK